MPANDTTYVNARGMKCPWPALRAARAMRSADAVTVEADDPNAARELEALTRQHGWNFSVAAGDRFELSRKS
ncbi:sulfurtransferase TusA family protein [Sphingobium sp. Cam5-1]|uniref:sulfurtransferase TusA family protein n=1 Tax=Sphingobium sp. Cam5-1 TaxID=2789327 RepID=UPI0018AD2AD8|nr:sulfurtransferase TusA family protein [Sphingobium sp. Cam5-1]QPI71874.1 sulfurtransferase TusA family protein [Sphingobium sp. Cam5-1]